MQTTESEFAIVGGGVVGLSVAYGLLCRGKRVTVFDEGDNAIRASRGNFGLVWVQGKGAANPPYARWTRRSAKAWPQFARQLADESGQSLNLQQRGGYSIHLSEQSLADNVDSYEQLREALGGDYPFEVLGHNAIKKEEPCIGPSVAGAILHHEDGHVNPLVLLRTLAQVVRERGAQVITNNTVQHIQPEAGGFAIQATDGVSYRAHKVVICAGLGAKALAPMLGFDAPVYAQRGQVLITEKMPPMINRPTGEIRQVDEGGIQIGASAELADLDDSETIEVTAKLAHNAIQIYPALATASLVRSWAALRIMTPDGYPIYQHSNTCPGAFYVTCHSGITLAAAHALILPEWLCSEGDTAATIPLLSAFSEARFHV